MQNNETEVCYLTMVEALPIWARHVETARQQTQDAIVALSARFAGIAQRLDSLLSQTANGYDATTDIHQSERDLRLVMDALRVISQSHGELAREVQGLVVYAEELRRMASEVESIAFQTNMLALNAAIEAAHAGEMGKGFAVVAHEVRSLSNAARETGKRITHKITVITDALRKIDETNEQVARRDQLDMEKSESHIGAVLARFNQSTAELAQAALSSREHSRVIKDEIDDSLVQLQFADRVSQIQAHVVSSMEGAGQWCAEAAPDANPESVEQARTRLATLMTGYTTDEQHQNHQNLDAQIVAPRAVTFF